MRTADPQLSVKVITDYFRLHKGQQKCVKFPTVRLLVQTMGTNILPTGYCKYKLHSVSVTIRKRLKEMSSYAYVKAFSVPKAGGYMIAAVPAVVGY